MNTIALNSNNSNVHFILGATPLSSLNYQQAYQNDPDKAEKLNGYIFFDLYKSRIFLNGKTLSWSITKRFDSNHNLIGYQFDSNDDTILIGVASIGTFDDNGLIIHAQDVQEGLMSKQDKVAIEYVKGQLGFNVILEGDNIKIVLADPKFNPKMSWNDWQ